MELTKHDTQKAKGIAILGMVMLHLFCRLDTLPYTPLLYIGETPLVYYLGLFGDICVPIYCFCSGYAHSLLKERLADEYNRSIPQKLLRFLRNYWEILLVFTIIGLASGNAQEIPGSFPEFLGNFFLYRLTYNGAWWFVVTYIFLSLLSPLLIAVVKKLHWLLLLPISFAIYIAGYIFRFNITLTIDNVVLDWIWQQLVLLGTSQFPYLIGLICRKEQWATKLRCKVQRQESGEKLSFKKCILLIIVWILPLVAFLGHCIVQPLIVAPVTAAAVLVFLFAVKLPRFVDAVLLFMGKHSTNIWFTHMFFYLTLFEGLVFVARYPLLILMMMLAITVGMSYAIQFVDKCLSKALKW